jgi:hypothetical protein
VACAGNGRGVINVEVVETKASIHQAVEAIFPKPAFIIGQIIPTHLVYNDAYY